MPGFAPVDLEDPHACVDLGELSAALDVKAIELTAEFPDNVDVFRVGVAVVADGNRRRVEVTVRRQEEIVWPGVVTAVANECPTTSVSVAAKVYAGVRQFIEREPPSLFRELAVPLFASVGMDGSFDKRAGLGLRAGFFHGSGFLQVGVDAQISEAVPLSDGEVHIAQTTVLAGIAWEPAGPDWRLRAGLDGGLAALWGTGFDRDDGGLAPVAGLRAGASIRVLEGIYVEGDARVGLVRGNFVLHEDAELPEPLLRVELAFVPTSAERSDPR